MGETELGAFRDELRGWLERNVPDDLRPENAARLPDEERQRRLRAWQHQLADARWVGITWPRAYGGRDAGIPEQIAYVEEMSRARAPEIVGNLGIGIAGPTILAYGTEAQKQRFAPRILTAEDLWCFGFSEPGAGSSPSPRSRTSAASSTWSACRSSSPRRVIGSSPSHGNVTPPGTRGSARRSPTSTSAPRSSVSPASGRSTGSSGWGCRVPRP